MKAGLTSLAMVFALSTSARAFADVSAPSSSQEEPDAARGRARVLFEKGASAFDARRFEEARALLTESFGIHQSYDTAGLLGQTEIDLGQYRSAAAHLDYCQRHFPTGENVELLNQVKVAFSAVQNQLGTLQINVDVSGAEVFVDGEAVGTSPLGHKVFVDPGTHSVRVVVPDAEPIVRVLSVARGHEEIVNVQVRAAASDAPVAPQEEKRPDSSTKTTATTTAAPPSERNWVPAYILGGVTVASLATSLVFRGMAANDAEEVDRLGAKAQGGCSGSAASSGDCQALSTAIDSHDQKADFANVSLVVAGVGAVATAGYVTYTLMQSSGEAPVKAAVAFDGTAGRLFVRGRF